MVQTNLSQDLSAERILLQELGTSFNQDLAHVEDHVLSREKTFRFSS